ncbi:MAG: outer membrane beta-barrel protein, partial [Bacteroidales bacterium]
YISDYEETKNLNFKTAYTYEIGASLNMYLDYTGRNKFCIQLSPTLYFVEYYSNEERPLSPLLYVYKLNIRYTTLKIPLLLKYSFYSSNRSIFPYMKLGPGLAIYLSQKGAYEYYSVPIAGSTDPTAVYNKPLNQVAKFTYIYFMAGIGTDIIFGNNLMSVGVTYEYGEGQLKGFRSDAQLQIEFQF